MSGGRDADVMVETIDALAERWAGQLPKREFTALKRRFAELAEQAREDTTQIEELAGELAGARERAAALPLEGCNDGAMRAGTERAYRRGRKALAAAEQGPSTERLHDWRKRVKDLWYHHRLLADAWPGPVKAFADEADRLGKLLGDDHDLTTLSERLGSDEHDPAPPSVDVNLIQQLIAARRTSCRPKPSSSAVAYTPKRLRRSPAASHATCARRTRTIASRKRREREHVIQTTRS
jgi:CHAD domain-containing protein